MLVAGVELTRQRDLVDAEAGLAAVRCSVASAYSLPWCSATPSAIRCWVAHWSEPLRSSDRKPRVGAQRGGSPTEHSEEVRQLSAARQGALEHRDAALGRGDSSWTWNLLSLIFILLHFLRAAYER